MTNRQFVLSIYPKAFVYKASQNVVAIFDRAQAFPSGHEPLSHMWCQSNKDAWSLAADEIRFKMLQRFES